MVFDPNAAEAGTPKERFAYLFPSRDSALISVRLRPDLTDEERPDAIDLFRQAVKDPRFALNGGSYMVTGAPLWWTPALGGSAPTLLLLGVAVLVIALALLVFLPPLRLLPLGVAVARPLPHLRPASRCGGSLTIGAIAMLPVLVGLAVDYAIQFQARFNEARLRARRRGAPWPLLP